jgi:cytochrome c oxidase assembly protein subunit 15
MTPLTVAAGLVAIAGAVGTLQYHILDYPAGVVWVHVALTASLFAALSWAVVAAGQPEAAPGLTEPPTADALRELQLT